MMIFMDQSLEKDALEHLDKAIRRVPDFPKSGITFYDITSVLADPGVFKDCVDRLSDVALKSGATCIAGIEARGFLFASAIGMQTGLPIVLVRKPGKLPNPCKCASYDLEYGSDRICMQEVDMIPGRKVFLVDDLIATGGTLQAAASLISGAGLSVAGIGAVIGLPFLGYSRKLSGIPVHVLISYDCE